MQGGRGTPKYNIQALKLEVTERIRYVAVTCNLYFMLHCFIDGNFYVMS